MHPIRAIGAARGVPDLVDVAQQPQVHVVALARLLGVFDPPLVGGRLDVENLKQERDRVPVPMFVDEPHDRRRVWSCSTAK